MSTPILAVVFDLGGTLEEVYFDNEIRRKACPLLGEILARNGIDLGLDDAGLFAFITERFERYSAYRATTLRQASPERIWSEFILAGRDVPRAKVEALAEELQFCYDVTFYTRTMRPEAPEALAMLKRLGYKLGIISNISSRGQVRFDLQAYGLEHYFDPIIPSSVFGWRKPSPRIFLEATRRLKLPPSACAFVGDTVSRDVVGARHAGYGLAIQIKSWLTGVSDSATDTEQPDALVKNLLEVVEVVEATKRG